MPSRSLGVTHIALLAILIVATLLAPGTFKRRLLLVVGVLLVILLPVRWVGPLWTDIDPLKFALGFYISLFLSLALPFGLTAIGIFLIDRRVGGARPLVRAAATVALYLVGLLVSYPVTLNYALLYPLVR